MSGALTRWSEQDEQKNLASVTPFGRWRAESFDRLIFQHPAKYVEEVFQVSCRHEWAGIGENGLSRPASAQSLVDQHAESIADGRAYRPALGHENGN